MTHTEGGPAQAAERLQRATRVLVTGHRRPDGDSLGSELALAELAAQLGIDATITNRDPAPPSLCQLEGIDVFPSFDQLHQRSPLFLAEVQTLGDFVLDGQGQDTHELRLRSGRAAGREATGDHRPEEHCDSAPALKNGKD